jgi:hypothetical protein
MSYKKLPFRIRALIAGGLLMTTLPLLFKEFITIPDYFRGLLAGLGLGLEITGLILARHLRKPEGELNCMWSRQDEAPQRDH